MKNPYPYSTIERFPIWEMATKPFSNTLAHIGVGVVIFLLCPPAGVFALWWPWHWYKKNGTYTRPCLTATLAGLAVTLIVAVCGWAPIAVMAELTYPYLHGPHPHLAVPVLLWLFATTILCAPAWVWAGIEAWGRCAYLDLAHRRWLLAVTPNRAMENRMEANIAALASGTNPN